MTSQTTLPSQLLPATDEEVAGAYAAAYASADVDALTSLLAPEVVCRLLMPGGVQELQGADTFVEALAGAVSEVDAWRFHSSSVAPIGDKFVTRSRLALEVAGAHYQLEHQEVVTVRGGRVVAIDGVCTGFRPVVAQASDARR